MAESWKRSAAQEFKRIVDEKVEPVNRQIERGIRTFYPSHESALVRTTLASVVLDYFTHDLSQPSYKGVRGLGFVPSHGIEVISSSIPYSVAFGVREEDDSIIGAGNIHDDSTLAIFGIDRHELDRDQTETVIDVMRDPRSQRAAIENITTPDNETYAKIEANRRFISDSAQQYLNNLARRQCQIRPDYPIQD